MGLRQTVKEDSTACRRPSGQLFHFETIDSVGDWWFFTVIFRYSQDETALHILSVTWREMIEQ